MTQREKFEIALANVGWTHISLLFNGERYVVDILLAVNDEDSYCG